MNVRCSTITIGSAVGPVFALSLFLFLNSVPTRAAVNESIPDAQALAQLELRATQAKPREQCFLYTELVHSMTQLAGKQMLDGDVEEAAATLKKIEHYAQLIHLNLANDTKRVKDAEMLMQHTTSHLGSYIRQTSGDERSVMQATLAKLDRVHDEMLTQVFNH
jgi:hypothetical protein